MVSLEKGNHEVEFLYKVPGLKTGSIVSFGSLLIFGIALSVQQRKKKKIPAEGEIEQDEYEKKKLDKNQTGLEENSDKLAVPVDGDYDSESDTSTL